jgi:hypothetical protein
MHGFGFAMSRRRLRAVAPPASWSHDWLAAGTNPAGTTFLRAGSGHYQNASGIVTSAAADTARFPYGWNGAAYALLGLRMDPQVTNHALYCADFVAGWAATFVSVAVDAASAPDGTSLADKLIAQATSGQHRAQQTMAGITYAGHWSIYMAPAGYDFGSLRGQSNGINFQVTVNLLTGAIDTIDNIPASDVVIEKAANGYWKVTLIKDFGAQTSALIFVSPVNASGCTRDAGYNVTYTGDGTSGILVWGAGFNSNLLPSADIFTTSAAVTRARESLKGTLTGVIPIFNAGQGTFWVEADVWISGTDERTLFSIYKASDPTAERIKASCVGGNVVFEITAGGAAQASIAVARTRAFKAAMRFAANDAQLAVNGTLGAADASVTLPAGLDTLALGCGAGTGVELGGLLKAIGYQPAPANDATLQGLST